ncbi:MAG: hypothetical protein RLZZ230_420 [Candidatus Parcubacteria bacterium]|jgi:hypothetical protein
MNAHHFNNYRFLIILAFSLAFFPNVSFAAVSISEVAWMGSATSANYEWIELHNDGEATDVTGWVLSDGLNLSIELTGIIPSGEYAVLERTSEVSAPGEAFFIYTGALVNSGATLKLVRTDGSIVDQVSGGENWVNIGGDNLTKETAQYTSAGWVTAAATPGRGITAGEVNVAAADAAATTETKTVTKSSGSSGSSTAKPKASEPVRLIIPGVTLKLKVGAQTVGYVNQAIAFNVEATDIGDNLINSLTYEWNFGDGFTATNKEVEHVFLYPGTYVVTVYGNFKRQEQVARYEITILPVMVSLTTNDRGDVQINNDSPYEIDISGYQVRGGKTFVFPPRSIMLPNQTITIPKTKLGNNTNLAVLYDNEQSQVASLFPTNSKIILAGIAEADNQTPVVTASSISYLSAPLIIPSENFGFSSAPSVTPPVDEIVINTEPTTSVVITNADIATATQLASVVLADKTTDSRWTYLALVGVLLLGTLAIYAKPRDNQNS